MILRERLEHLLRKELGRRGLARAYPTVALRDNKICFRLSDLKTEGISKWSCRLSEEEVPLELHRISPS